MSNIVLRSVKGSPLTYEEIDGNFNGLDHKFWIGTVDPTADDDSSKGYDVGSHWFNTATKKTFYCTDATAGAAVWEEVIVKNVPSGGANGYALIKTSDDDYEYDWAEIPAYDDTALSDRVTALEEPKTVVAGSNAIDFSNKYIELTATAANITATNIPNTPKEGKIIIHSAENIPYTDESNTGWGAEFKFKNVPTDLSGDELFSYFIKNNTTIWMSRVV